jgi:potassium-transporting ATPase potassium-binding subunit
MRLQAMTDGALMAGQFGLLVLLTGLLVRPLGGYLARVYAGQPTPLRPILAPVETALYRIAGVDADVEQSWFRYTVSLLVFNLAGIAALFLLLFYQDRLPFNPQNLPGLTPDLAFNTAVSFVTNTSWQSYGGETTLSYLSQMAGIGVHSFLSTATGLAVAIALIRPPQMRNGRQFLGRSGSRGTLPAAADLPDRRAGAFVGGGTPDPGGQRRGSDPGGRQPDHRARTGRQPGSH